MSEEVKDKNLTQIGGGVETLIDDPNWKTYKIMRKMATGQGINNQIIDLRNYSNGVDWKNTKLCVGLSHISVNANTSKIVSDYKKLDDNSFKLICYTDNFIYTSKVDDTVYVSGNRGHGQSSQKSYKGNYLYLTGEYSGRSGKEGNCNAYLSYRYTIDGQWSEWIPIVSKSVGNKGNFNGKFSKDFKFDSEIDLELSMSAYAKGAFASSYVVYSVFGGTKTSGELIDGSLEWLAYEE